MHQPWLKIPRVKQKNCGSSYPSSWLSLNARNFFVARMLEVWNPVN